MQEKTKEIENLVFNIDSEWSKEDKMLTLQILIQVPNSKGKEFLFVYYNSDYKEHLEKNIYSYMRLYHKPVQTKNNLTPKFVS